MRDYQPQVNNKYYLPDTTYKLSLAMIRDYYHTKTMIDAILYESPAPPDGMPRGSGVSDPTSSKAMRLEEYYDKIRKIDDALDTIPKIYQRGVWDNIMFGTPYPGDAARSTYSSYKSKFIYGVADSFHLFI